MRESPSSLLPASTRDRRRSRGSGGYTLLEAVVAVSCFSLLGIAFLTMYTSMLTLGARVATTSYTSWTGANAIGTVNQALREAQTFYVMDGGTYGPSGYVATPGDVANNPYLAKDASGNAVAVTGIHIVFPASKQVSISVPGAIGTSTTPLQIVDPKTGGDWVEFYRSNRDGTPNPNKGSCLWMRGTLNGSPVANRAGAAVDGESLINDIASTRGALQFIHPTVPGTTTPVSNQIQIKLVTGTYNRTTGMITSESTKGGATALSGEQTYLRNHDPNGVSNGSAHGQSQYNGS